MKGFMAMGMTKLKEQKEERITCINLLSFGQYPYLTTENPENKEYPESTGNTENQ